MILKKIYFFFPALVLFSGCGDAGKIQEFEPLNITFSSPAQMWEETMPLGNGQVGAMPDGGITKETIVLNEETMWSGCEWDPSNPEAKQWLPEIREKLLEGDNLTLADLFRIQDLLYESDLPYMFDVSIFSKISNPDLTDHIRRKGIVIWERK